MRVNEMIYPEENSSISNNKSSSNKKTVISTEVTEPSENNDLCSFEVGLMFFYIMVVLYCAIF